jgi:hypothetical protein
MTLGPGSRVGVYEIISMVGAGGMGEVYRARDTRLSRDVAIKVLPAGLVDEADRRVRFEREAQVLASLNHAGIATIHGVEESAGCLALVMELVEGETLDARLKPRAPGVESSEGARGFSRAIPLDEAVPIARQICEALEYAHERGIIHRDLKPANIKVRPDGAVKLLDFGLAKALEPDPTHGSNPSATHSPTLSLAGTRAGVILGTAAYMAPEQARGGAADRRSDIWAFGCVLFEMLTGKQTFGGPTVSDALAAVLRAEPDWTSLPANTPGPVRRLLKRCVQKDPKRRLQHIGDARLELDEPLTPAGETALPGRSRDRRGWLLLAGILVGGATTGAVWAVRTPRAPARGVSHFLVGVPGRMATGGAVLTLSPDGRTLLSTIGPGGGLSTRRLDAVGFEPVRGAEGGFAPFISPDSTAIGFFAGDKLKKVPVAGGVPVTLCDAIQPSRGAWGDDGSIIVTRGSRMFRVPSSGGVLQQVSDFGPEVAFEEPFILPGSRAVLANVAANRIEAVDLRTLSRHALVEGRSPRLSADGDLLFEHAGGIWAVGFNAERLAIVGEPVRVIDSVRVVANRALFTTARDGSLAYVAGNDGATSTMVWLDRTGTATPAFDVRAEFQTPRLSPDGKRVAVSVPSPTGSDLWVYEFDRGARLRLTTSNQNRRSVWYPDGSRIAFYSNPGGDQDIFVVPSTGGEPQALLRLPRAQFPDAWSPDGRLLIFSEGVAVRDLWLLPIGEEPRPLVVTSFNERGAVFSPDGRWLAFVSDESGRDEVYVQAFPGPSTKFTVSSAGGIQPMWSRGGRELFYREGDWLMEASFDSAAARVSSARRLFEFRGLVYNADPNVADYDVAPDGRFFAARRERTDADDLHLILNWSEELRRALKR